jgi:sulfoxide reductase heme-binding subunit YedZ
MRKISGMNWLIRLRRPIGLFAFFYALLHFTTYVWLDKFFDVVDMVKDVAKRPFITAGFSAFLLLIPLAATSTTASMRRLGRKWQLLHRLIYISAVAAVVHFWWKVKADTRTPAIYASILAILLLYRVVSASTRSSQNP